MDFFDKLKAILDTTDEKQFYTYISSALGALVLLVLLVMFYYVRSTGNIKKKIQELNTIRSGQIKQILTKADLIKKQKEALDTMLEEDPEFKLTEHLEKVLAQLNLSDRKDRSEPLNKIDIDDKYTENKIEFTLNDIDMKQLVEFLVNIESNRRVYTKKLEITKSKTTPMKLEARITIATLFPKSA